jgi:hypothetical protein
MSTVADKTVSVPYFYLNSSIPIYSGSEPLIHTRLTEHQKRVISYIRLLESEHPIPIPSKETTQDLYIHTNYAFYADPICSGKSYVILSLLSLHRCIERKKLLTIWSNGLGMNVFSKIQNFEIPLSILVVPQCSLAQWNFLFERETQIKYIIVDHPQKIEEIDIKEYEVLVVADFVFDKVCIHFQGFSVSRLIFDDLLHLDIKNLNQTDLFGDLCASFTWLVSSEPFECLQKYRGSKLPFAPLIQQIFSFPYRGLLFRSENESLEKSLSVILPQVDFHFKNIYLDRLPTHQEDPKYEIQNVYHKIKNLSSNLSPNFIKIYILHMMTLLNQQLDLQIKSLDSFSKKEIVEERLKEGKDPITYEPIVYPSTLNCCFQVYDLLSLIKCLVEDQRCPFCRKNVEWRDIFGIEHPNYLDLDANVWSELESKMKPNDYNVFYIPFISKKKKKDQATIWRNEQVNRFIKQLSDKYKCFLFNKNSNPKKVFEQFKNEKGILIITKPIHSNLHLTFIDHLFVFRPKEFICETQPEWFTNDLKPYYSKWIENWEDRSLFSLTDLELGNFCIGRNNLLKIDVFSFL